MDPNYEKLCDAFEKQNYEDAFKAAHTMKGVSQNLGFKDLSDSVCLLTEELRNYQQSVDVSACQKLFAQVCADYDKTAGAIRLLQEE